MANFTPASRKLLALVSTETKILNVLASKKSFSVTALAAKVRLPRTTVGYTLTKLKRRGLTTVTREGRIAAWRAADTNVVADTLKDQLVITTLPHRNRKAVEVKAEVYYGRDQVLWGYRQGQQAGRERVYMIQGVKSTAAAIKKFAGEFIIEQQGALKKKGVVVEGVVSELLLKTLEQMTTAELVAHLDRRVVAYIVPAGYLELEVDIMIIGGTVYLIDPINEAVSVLHNDSVAEAFRQIVALVRDHVSKINLNAYIRELVSKRQG